MENNKDLSLVGIHWPKKGRKDRKPANSNTSLSLLSCLLPLFLGKLKEYRPKLVPIGGWHLPVSCPVWPQIRSSVSQLCCPNSKIQEKKKRNRPVCDLWKFAIYFSALMCSSTRAAGFPLAPHCIYSNTLQSGHSKKDTANHFIVKHAPWSRSLTINQPEGTVTY